MKMAATSIALHRLVPNIARCKIIHQHFPFQRQSTWRRQQLSTSNSSREPATCSSNKTPPPKKRRLDVAIVGPPNAGKSQLLNTITSTTVAAVSRKRHTTRTGILATHTKDNAQLVFIDTPGFVRYNSAKEKMLYKELVQGAENSIDRADYTLVVLDAAKKITDDLRDEMAMLMLAAHSSRGRIEDVKVNDDGEIEEVLSDEQEADGTLGRERFAIVFNKVDLVNPKKKLLDLAEDMGALADACVRYRGEIHDEKSDFNIMDNAITFSKEEEIELAKQYPPVFFISALKNDGVEDLLQHLCSYATPTECFVLPPGQKTSLSLAERIEEVIREKIYRCLHREVPHSITQVNRILKRGKTRSGKLAIRIDQDLVVKTKSHQKLVLGRGGMTLKRIEDTARRDLIKMLSSEGYEDVILNVHVKFSKSQHQRHLEAEMEGVVQRKL